ncbi:polysaccharide deacetylase family protein [Pseudidiomarina aestuarii]|uniref:polysaccharide deacetylase family protein n=1 Tax=Pseudidiomarina aestuarii TaxID=624146 RepID=UPI003A96AD75
MQLSLKDRDDRIRFDVLQDIFHDSCSDFPCKQWSARSEGYIGVVDDVLPAPSLECLPEPLIELDGKGAIVHYDILGLTYWMLTRIEEVERNDLDAHLRFPATSSHAWRHGYLERPVVDEWLNILGQVILKVWPERVLRTHRFRVCVSHDVDVPSLYAFKSWKVITRIIMGHLFKRRDMKALMTTLYLKFTTRRQLSPNDPYNTFEWLMDVSEANNLQSAFYFICGRTDKNKDADYELEHPVLRNLLCRIHKRGHEIGLHPSYGSFLLSEQITRESKRLKQVCSEEGISQKLWGGRMHYLRWQQPTTLVAWANAGMDYDATLGYADKPGFRCGTCHEYPAFDPVSQQALNMRIRPLIVMECTVLDEAYLGLGNNLEAAFQCMQNLKSTCKKVGGIYSLLWHNSYLTKQSERELYLACIEGD